MPVEALRKQWDTRASSAPLHRFMTFEGDALVLGAGTKLASVDRGGSDPGAEVSPTGDARLVVLLSVAYGRPIEVRALSYIGHALVKQSEGETTVALTHLALSGLPKLNEPKEDARRLFIADGLMKEGVSPRTILQTLAFDPEPLDAMQRRYNRDQPRVPAGNGRPSGQWASTDGTTAAAERKPSSGHPIALVAAESEENREDNERERAPFDRNSPRLGQELERDLIENGVITEVAGISVWGTARIANGVAIYGIGAIASPEDNPQNLFEFVREVDETSWKLGARSEEIYGFGIINQRLFNPAMARRLGFKYEVLDFGRVIHLTKTLLGPD